MTSNLMVKVTGHLRYNVAAISYMEHTVCEVRMNIMISKVMWGAGHARCE